MSLERLIVDRAHVRIPRREPFATTIDEQPIKVEDFEVRDLQPGEERVVKLPWGGAMVVERKAERRQT